MTNQRITYHDELVPLVFEGEEKQGYEAAKSPNIDVFIAAEQTDSISRQQAELVRTAGSPYDVDRDGLLVWRSTVDGALQKLVSVSLRPCTISL